MDNRLKRLINEALEEVMDECGMGGNCAPTQNATVPVNEDETATPAPAPQSTPSASAPAINEEESVETVDESISNIKNLMERMGCNINETHTKSNKSLLREHYSASHY